ncbi:MAG: hypothetical protein QNJ44_22770 [Rhodobacter sp.]|nr:hypothetical protein [Rhodobacter sp.]
MNLLGAAKLRRQLRALDPALRKHMPPAIRRGTEEGVRVAKILAPDVTGETKGKIRSEYKDEGMTGVVVAIESDATRAEKDKAYSIEHGRKKGQHGTTEGYHHLHQTRRYLAKKNKNRMRRATNKAVREAARRG